MSDLFHEAPADQSREEDLFCKALAIAPAERTAFLERQCADDPGLRARVESLLAAHEQRETLLPYSPEAVFGLGPSVAASEAPDDSVGLKAGRYTPVEKIGEGGCGVVYVAEQTEPVRRRVALKVIKRGMDTRDVIARFEAERQALALMDHPGIARVLDAGTTNSGRPYFVMELVRGVRITEFCDRRGLGVRERIELFIKVCQAVQHAHQKGIIHRDIKPSNILVIELDGVAVPKVIDFGIAKAVDGRLTNLRLKTQMHQFLGTPAYMAPEQADMAELDIDTRSDIYSLGVLLYELLTGVTPFDAAELGSMGIDAIRRVIREKEPVRPSVRLAQLGKTQPDLSSSPRTWTVSSDLDWVVMKCLEKERTRRNETANGLAADLRRHLNNEPVVARPASAWYRLRKAVARNRVACAVAGAIAASLIVASVTSVWQMTLARESERTALNYAHQMDLARQNAQAILQFLTNILARPDPDMDGHAVTVAEVLNRAASSLEVDLLDQPQRRALLQTTLADTYRALGLYRESVPLLEDVLRHTRGTAGPTNAEAINVAIRLAESYGYVGRHAEAVGLKEEVLAHRRRTLGADHPDTLAAMDQLAVSYEEVDRLNEALNLNRELVELHGKVNGPAHRNTISARRRVACLVGLIDEPGVAIQQLEALLPLARESLGPEDREMLWIMAELAGFHAARSEHEQAITYRRQILDLSRGRLGPEHPDTLHAMYRLADSMEATGQARPALELRETAVSSLRRILGDEHEYTVTAMAALATSYHQAPGKLDDAIRMMEKVLEIRRRLSGSEHRRTLLVMHLLASYYHDAGRADDALRLGEEVVAGRRRAVGDDDPDTLWSLANLGEYYERVQRPSEALEAREEVFTRRQKILGPSHVDTLLAMERLAQSYRAVARDADAERLERELTRLRGLSM